MFPIQPERSLPLPPLHRPVVRSLAVFLSVVCALLLFGGGAALAPSAASAATSVVQETALEEGAGESVAAHRRTRARRLWRPRGTATRPAVVNRSRGPRRGPIPRPPASFAANRSSPRRGPPLLAS